MTMSAQAAIVAIILGVVAICVGEALPVQPVEQPAEPVRAVHLYNLPKNSTLAMKGYDPVAYFPEGGKKAIRGLESISLTYKSVTYRFASEEHLALFRKDPSRYEPAYGGWCAWAMLDGDKVEVDPRKFIVKDGRLFLFYNGLLNDTRAKWLDHDHEAQAAKADAQWKKLSGEEPRKPKKDEGEKDAGEGG